MTASDPEPRLPGKVVSEEISLGPLARLLGESLRICVLTGAGISTDSGIPDFRGPEGVWTKDPSAEKLSSLSHYVSSREVRMRAWRGRVDHPAWAAQPNPGHLALVELERRGKLERLITQNIDGLHLKAGNSPERVIEIHGTLREYQCLSCGGRGPMPEALERVRSGEVDPPCLSCGGILKSATISFGQALRPGDLLAARRSAAACDLFLAAGTTLTVYPVAELPALALRSGARLVIINAEPTAYDGLATQVVRGSISAALPQLLG